MKEAPFLNLEMIARIFILTASTKKAAP